MKPFTILLPLLLVSCTAQQQPAKPAPVSKNTISKQSPQLQQNGQTIPAQYEEYLKSLDKEQPNNVKAAILNYAWLFKNRDTAVCDSGYALFNEFYEEAGRYMQNHQSPEEIPAKRKAAFLKQLKQYGFTIEAAEGSYVYANDRDSVNPKFYTFVSPTMQQFMLQQHLETNKGRSSAEGAMAIPPAVFVKRYIFWQRFSEDHPLFLLKQWVFAFARSYAEDLVFGMENTPLQENGALSGTYQRIYTLLLNEYGTEKFVTCYKPYYEALLNNDETFIESFKENFRAGSNEKTFPDTE